MIAPVAHGSASDPSNRRDGVPQLRTRNASPTPTARRAGAILVACAVWMAIAAPTGAAAASPLAAVPAAEAPAEGPIGGRTYRLSAGDKIMITVYGQADLSGEFLIDGSGEVTMALIGPVLAADTTVGELRALIEQRLADGFMLDPKVSVRITEFRPIVIVGNVRSPGSYPYRHGMSVLTALALAGGLSLTEERQDHLRGEMAQAEERVHVLTSSRQALLARLARLTAQRDDLDEIDFAAFLGDDAKAPHLARILDGEREILRTQRGARDQDLELLSQQAPRAKAEAQAIAAQRRLERSQLDLVNAQIGDMKALLARGLARRASMVQLQREEARIQGNIAKLTADAARIEQAAGEVELKIQAIESGYRRRVLDELQVTQVRMMEAEASLRGAIEARDIKAQQASLAAGLPTPSSRENAITVLHHENGRLVSRQATEATVLRPGDTVRIELGAEALDATGSPGSSRRVAQPARLGQGPAAR